MSAVRPRSPLSAVLPLVVAVLVGGVGWWADGVVRRAVETKLTSELQTVLNANVTALEIWMNTQKRLAMGIAEDPEIRAAARGLLEGGPRTNRVGFQPGAPRGSEFDRAVQERMRTAGFFVAQLVTTNQVIVSGFGRGGRWSGLPVPDEHQAKFAELFATGEPVIITPFKPRRDPGRGPGFGPGRFGRGGPGALGGPDFQGRPGNPGATNAVAHGTNRPPARPMGPPPELADGPPPGAGPGSNLDPGPGPGPGSGPGMEPRMGPGPERADRGPGPGFGPGSGPPGGGPGRPPGGPPGGGIMQVAAPIRDADGTVRGAVAFLLNPELEFSRILSVARPGASGETYAFDASGLMLSQSRFDTQLKGLGLLGKQADATSALTLTLRDPGGDLTAGYPVPGTNTVRPLTQLVQGALQGGTGVEVRSSRDYRGVPVVGGWRWLTDHGFGVATQLDAIEAFRPLRILRSVFLLLIGLLAAFAGVALVVSHFNVVWRRKAGEAELKLRTLGQYTLEEKIGEGGMGVVYRARHALLRRDTAVKLLLPDRANESTVRQFEQEVRLTCGLTHPNTIQIYDFGRTPDGIFYYAMEYLRGLNLAELVGRYGPPPEERILHILIQVCDSLQEAHVAGLVHRDIKPANIFLCERGGVPDTVKVLDFGLVKRFDAGADSSAAEAAHRRLSGTPNYLPPETIRDPACTDPRSDIYALGAVACYLATGQPLFPSESVEEILERQLTAPPVPPRARGARIGPELEAIILDCLAKDPAARPATAADLRRRLLQCPTAGLWTLERRLAWWSPAAATESASPPAGAPDDEGGRTIEATLQIDFNQRTG